MSVCTKSHQETAYPCLHSRLPILNFNMSQVSADSIPKVILSSDWYDAVIFKMSRKGRKPWRLQGRDHVTHRIHASQDPGRIRVLSDAR